MMIFEESGQDQDFRPKKFKLIAQTVGFLTGLGVIVLFGIMLWHKASVVNIDKSSQRNHPTIYVPPGTPQGGTGILQGTLSIKKRTLSKFSVIIYHSDGTVASQLQTDAQGYYEVSLPSGYYTLQVKVAGQTHDRIVNVIKDTVDVENIKL